jgi:hypothetical protein
MMSSNCLSWEAMLDEFRALGGTADNVERRAGPYGFGLFPIDPARPVVLHVPAAMLIPCRLVREEGGDLVVANGSNLAADVADFFTRYTRAFSWGTDEPEKVDSFTRQVAQLPENIRPELVRFDIVSRLFSDPLATRAERFLQTRSISVGGDSKLMPVIELLNHSPYARGFNTRDGVRVSGNYTGEVLVHYGAGDAFSRFGTHMFVSDELWAFSSPFERPMPNGKILKVGRELQEDKEIGSWIVPIRRDEGNRTTLSHLMLGCARWPRVPRTIFRYLFPEFEAFQADELFQRIVRDNQVALLGLLDALEALDGSFIKTLRSVVRLQLKNIAEAYGLRDTADLSVHPTTQKA